MSHARRLLIAALVAHAFIGAKAVVESGAPAGDFDRYYEIASSPGRPYVDYAVEHPLGTLLLFKAFALTPGGRPSFGLAVVVANIAADGLIVLSLLWGWGEVAAACFALAVLPMIEVLFNRIDLWSMSAATLAVAAWRRDRRSITGVALAVGGSLKLWPLLFTTLLVSPRSDAGAFQIRRVPAGPVVVFALTAGLLAGVAWLIAGTQGVLQVLTFRGARGWQVESIVGSVIHLVDRSPIRLESGSWRIGEMGRVTAIVLFALAAPVSLWSSWRGARTARIGTGWLASVSTLLFLSALFSAQYVGWLVPGAAIAWTEGHKRESLVAAATVLLTGLFWNRYGDVMNGATYALLLVVLRNVVVGALVVMTIATLLRSTDEDLTGA
jgi:hypothetical protein